MPYRGIWLMTRKMRSVHYPVSVPCLIDAGIWCSYSCPHQLLVEGNLGLGRCHLREEGRKGFDEIEESDCD